MRAAQDGDVLTSESSVPSRARLTVLVAVTVIILDRITKWWIESRLEPGSCERAEDACIDLIGSLRLHFIENPGMAFSQGESVGPFLGIIALVMSGVLLRLAMQSVSPWRHVMFGLIIGGAIGNLIDRVVRAERGFLTGSVVDFIDLQWFPIWNVADAGITCGVIGLLLWGNRGEPDTSSAAHQTGSPHD